MNERMWKLVMGSACYRSRKIIPESIRRRVLVVGNVLGSRAEDPVLDSIWLRSFVEMNK